ncbi:MAG: IS1634 family transposase [Deltaproteobacteria bacterium]|nr:IS1634 family transposase [Deltaproteobacteria bacterium]MBW1720099.1 IS1634 family transposase [Deltaproteobacteria bacterium]MBW1965532.1 IS1634 family transposase [Deltaproteobacteria bacterium]MBW2081432.1 IS1634 family transposase [Deltaproteobacteria bacterium]MBW2351368.1 IS1634 family transposase [Deltaproteobacteria bacterium]
MAAIVYQTNKKTGVTYAYESISYWDKEKQQSRAKRKCIGRVDPKTKKIIPTHRKKIQVVGRKAKRGPVPITFTARSFYGATYLFDCIGEDTGVTEDLKACFPNNYRQILSIAYYLILEDKNPLSRFPRWAAIHRHPYGDIISSQRSSELFASITEGARQRFFRLQGERRVDREYLAYDSTSISSYSKCLRQVRYGKNKDHEHLAQINLTLLFGQKSRLPFYYRKLAGNIPDVKTLRKLLFDMNTLGYKKIKVVLDRGFYSAANINDLYRHHMKFLIAAKLSLKLVKTHLDTVRDTMRSWTHYSQAYQLYAYSLPVTWNYVQNRPYKGDTIKANRRMYLHLYYCPERALEDEKALCNRIAGWQEELESGQRHPDHEKQYAKYFEVTSTPVRGTKVIVKEEALAETKRNYGYFVLLSNEVKNAVKALEIYRNKDLVEKAFHNLKERLNLRRIAVSSEQSLDGKFFVQFIALIFLSYIMKKMQEKKLFKKHTMQKALDEFDIIECFEVPGQRLQIGETTKRQIDLYTKLGITPPTSLQ